LQERSMGSCSPLRYRPTVRHDELQLLLPHSWPWFQLLKQACVTVDCLIFSWVDVRAAIPCSSADTTALCVINV
jgi:hypothetical protein